MKRHQARRTDRAAARDRRRLCSALPAGRTRVATPTRLLAIAVDGPGQVSGNGIACRDGSGDCVELYADGTSVTLTAVPDSGASFTGWGGDCTAAADEHDLHA